MSSICEHEFEQPDRDNPNYSMCEFDLYARLGGLSIRKNLKTNEFEIFNHRTGELHYRYARLEDIVRIANRLEGEKEPSIVVECTSFSCPKIREYWKERSEAKGEKFPVFEDWLEQKQREKNG